MKRAVVLLGALAGIATATGPVSADGTDGLPAPVWQTDSDRCTWHWREGGGLGVWAEQCVFATGQLTVTWNEQASAFALHHDDKVIDIVIQSWTLAPDDTLSSLAPLLIAAGTQTPNADCVFEKIEIDRAPGSRTFYQLASTRSDALNMTASGEVPEPVCGPYGLSTHGVRYFMIDSRWPDRVVFVEEGQERPLFDPASITLLP